MPIKREQSADTYLFAEPLFTWCEPEEFLQVLKEHKRATNPWWQKPPAFAVFYFVSFMFCWWLARYN